MIGQQVYANDITVTDECADLTNVYEYSTLWTTTTSWSSSLGGDSTVLKRTNKAYTTADPQYLTYYREGLKEAKVLYYYTTDTAKNAVSIWYSKDNATWTEITSPKTEQYKNTSGSWNGMWIYTGNLPEGTKYFKVQITKSATPTSCGIGKVELEAFGNFNAYTDDMAWSGSFADSSHLWRVSADTVVSSSMPTKTGDENLLYGKSMILRVDGEKELLVTTHQNENNTPDKIYKLEYSPDLITWTEADFVTLSSVNYKNTSGEPYYEGLLKSETPKNAKYVRISWLVSAWYNLVGEVEMRSKSVITYDNLNDCKNLVGKSLYLAQTTDGDGDCLRKWQYYSGSKTFSADGEVVKKYGEYSAKQWIEYDISAHTNLSVAAAANFGDAATTKVPFKFYCKTSADGERIALDSQIGTATTDDGIRAVSYTENIPDNAVRLVIEWPAEGSFTYLNSVEFYEKGTVTVDRLKYYSDKERIYETPSSYIGKTAVTGVITNPNRATALNVRMWAALYDENNRLIGVNSKILAEGVSAGSEKTFSMDIEDKYGTGKKLGVFLWDGMNPISAKLADVTYNADEFTTTHGTFEDNFDDLTKMWSYPYSMHEKSADNSLIRAYDIPMSVKYNVENAKSIEITGRLHAKAGQVRVFVSSYDGDYREVNLTRSALTASTGGWYDCTYTADNFPSNTDFIKIMMSDGNGENFTPCLKKVSISY